MKILSKKLSFCCCFLFITATIYSQSTKHEGMTNVIMEKILNAEVGKIEGQLGNWQFIYGGQVLLILTDETHNRMRIFSPFLEEENLEEGALKKMMEANFHSALDAKYCLYEGFAISVYTHPLRELTRDQFIDAMKQVANLAYTYGSSYSSTDIIFGGGKDEKKEEDKDLEEKKNVNKKPGKGKS